MNKIVIKTMHGLGDCLYVRPVLKYLCPYNIHLVTPWPQIYHDINGLTFSTPHSTWLHSQRDNIALVGKQYEKPCHFFDYQLGYDLKKNSGLWFFFETVAGFQPSTVDGHMICQEQWKNEGKQFLEANSLDKKPICLIRPNTQRPEWFSWARSPRNKYLQLFVDMYRHMFHIISIANIKPNIEFYEKRLTGCDYYIEQPTLALTFGLFYWAHFLVYGPSFWLALAPAFDKPSLCVFGAGELPDRVIDSRLQNPGLTMIAPEPFDDCVINKRGAYKDIPQDKLVNVYMQKVSDIHAKRPAGNRWLLLDS